MAEAIFHLARSGCAWRMLPRHFPQWPIVHAQPTRWRKDGTPGACTTGCARMRAKRRDEIESLLPR
jgi:transposase